MGLRAPSESRGPIRDAHREMPVRARSKIRSSHVEEEEDALVPALLGLLIPAIPLLPIPLSAGPALPPLRHLLRQWQSFALAAQGQRHDTWQAWRATTFASPCMHQQSQRKKRRTDDRGYHLPSLAWYMSFPLGYRRQLRASTVARMKAGSDPWSRSSPAGRCTRLGAGSAWQEIILSPLAHFLQLHCGSPMCWCAQY